MKPFNWFQELRAGHVTNQIPSSDGYESIELMERGCNLQKYKRFKQSNLQLIIDPIITLIWLDLSNLIYS